MTEPHFHDGRAMLSVALKRTIAAIEGERVSLQQLLGLIGEQGLLVFCTVLTIPFLLPVSIPGVSTVFGLVIILIGVSVTLNRALWLPRRLLHHELPSIHLIPVLERGVHFVVRLERWACARLYYLTHGPLVNRVNGLALTAGGVLLLFPLSFIPFSNTLPALVVLLLALGMLQRDGYCIVAGYSVLVITLLYFGGLALLVLMGSQRLLT